MKKRAPVIDSPHMVTENSYNCIDTGSFYIACFKSTVLKVMDSDEINPSDSDVIIEKLTKAINGGVLGLNERKKMTKYAKGEINDDI